MSSAPSPRSLALPALPASAFSAIAEDELVVCRAGELDVARLQRAARTAARQGHWDAVDAALQKAERFVATNPWVAAALNELRALAARKDAVMFAKESAYSARRLSSRLSAHSEKESLVDAAPSASYLRRKADQGKTEERP